MKEKGNWGQLKAIQGILRQKGSRRLKRLNPKSGEGSDYYSIDIQGNSVMLIQRRKYG